MHRVQAALTTTAACWFFYGQTALLVHALVAGQHDDMLQSRLKRMPVSKIQSHSRPVQ